MDHPILQLDNAWTSFVSKLCIGMNCSHISTILGNWYYQIVDQ